MKFQAYILKMILKYYKKKYLKITGNSIIRDFTIEPLITHSICRVVVMEIYEKFNYFAHHFKQ